MNIYEMLKKVREDAPLIHHLTNWVTIYDCANIVKVFGASPVMAHAKEEVGDMSAIASALVLNIGTLTPEFIESMKIAAKSANSKNIPVVLDVCGAGATKLRDDKCFELLNETRIDIIKGNASEVARIAGETIQTKGVDSTDVGKDLVEIARKLADERNCTVVITGEIDFIADKSKALKVENGHEMMSNVVGTGCMATSVIGTFAAVESDLVSASAAGLACYEIAAQMAAVDSNGPATFKEMLFDNIFHLKKDEIEKHQKVTQI